MSVPEAAEKLGVTPARVRVLAREGRIHGAIKVGRDWVIPSPVVVEERGPGPKLRSKRWLAP
ncbi:MAG: helix-turn-helix domain-containing protein [Thermaerobacter sp.]|nr:helix-turn-helix domain-containing protein [Thermaerobacter sp.]